MAPGPPLTDYLEGPDPWEHGDEPDVLSIEPADLDTDRVGRMLYKLGRLEREVADYEAQATRERARIDEWLDLTVSPLRRQVAALTRLLEGWTRAHLRGQKRRTVSLPAGELKLRASRHDLVAVLDQHDADLVAWARATRPALVKTTTTYSVPKGDLKAVVRPGKVLGPQDPEGYVPHEAVTPEGELVPFVVVRVPVDPDRFGVELRKD